ncbi:DUF4321 domain-containing protein [Cohnella boryungensis]|jgi:uncharacterized membrane protein YeaQ/YmgE (transglycosylase-associated protein family)|uniref:DUF4321 domain-containing protein n=1 Tax=Cohnella boryungensis TaxID=768479 RepID=A0ABV8SGM7_9BACL
MKKNGWILLLFLFLGLLAGALLANWLQEVPGLAFLTRALSVSWSPAADLSVVKFSMNIDIRLSLLSIIGAVVAIWLYRKM